jgi:hypothetical protein
MERGLVPYRFHAMPLLLPRDGFRIAGEIESSIIRAGATGQAKWNA